ncbi:hypothetical protein RHMOL_Rhmol02G0017700 [Rhododendron molle]|uniref:Uncharacterized protein n=1 Tax=Rhododendron molle TaxID=49168 RepID=A0ACC0PKV3_RHOML|nr:hypothetical protein RHMOL_Rhmol02G0017700 [Rhododendron molle]
MASGFCSLQLQMFSNLDHLTVKIEITLFMLGVSLNCSFQQSDLLHIPKGHIAPLIIAMYVNVWFSNRSTAFQVSCSYQFRGYGNGFPFGANPDGLVNTAEAFEFSIQFMISLSNVVDHVDCATAFGKLL